MRKGILIAAMTVVPLLFAGSASAQVKLFGGGHFQGSGQAVAEAFTAKTGIKATYTPGNTGNGGFVRRMTAGEVIDVIVMNRDEMDEMVTAGTVKRDSVVTFARDRMAVAVKKGAPKPDVSTPEKLKAALLAARAVGMQEPDPTGHSGQMVRGILTDLGIFDQVMKKAVIIDNATDDIVAGKVDFEFWSYPEILRQPMLDLVAPVPGGLGGFVDQAIGVPTSNNRNDADARALIRFISGPDGRAVWTKTGLDPLARN